MQNIWANMATRPKPGGRIYTLPLVNTPWLGVDYALFNRRFSRNYEISMVIWLLIIAITEHLPTQPPY